MNAAMPPIRCALATACSATVVFPEPSGPYISTTRPRGRPPMPSATSRAIDPVGITSIGARPSSPSRMIEPLPNCRSIWASAVSRDLSLSPALLPALSLPAMWTPVGDQGLFAGPDATRLYRHRFVAMDGRPGATLDEQLFDHEQDTPNSSRNFPAIRLDPRTGSAPRGASRCEHRACPGQAAQRRCCGTSNSSLTTRQTVLASTPSARA